MRGERQARMESARRHETCKNADSDRGFRRDACGCKGLPVVFVHPLPTKQYLRQEEERGVARVLAFVGGKGIDLTTYNHPC